MGEADASGQMLGSADELGVSQPGAPVAASAEAAADAALAALAAKGFQGVGKASDVLIVVDVLNDFCEGGALYVQGGDDIVPLCNALATRFEHVVYAQDWHTKGHDSFASSHEGKVPYDSYQAHYGEQTLWPDHCVQGSEGAHFHPDLTVPAGAIVVRKGFRSSIDSYSAFRDNDHNSGTGLSEKLSALGVRRAVCIGLAYDFCVTWTAVDALEVAGLDSTALLRDATRSVGLPGTIEAADKANARAGVIVV